MRALVVVCCLALAAGCSTEQEKKSVSVGQPAPDFTLKDAGGKTRTLAEYQGKFVVLEWVNFGCPFVRKHYDSSNMQNLQEAYTAKGAVWLSICSSAPGKQGHFKGKELLDQIAAENFNGTAYLIDEDGKVGRMYGAKTTPHMYLIDPEGVLLYAGAIDDKPSTKKEDINKARSYVRLALDAALKDKEVEIKTTQPYGCSVKY